MRALQIDAAVVAVLTLVAYLTGHFTTANVLGWIVFPLIIIADYVGQRREKRKDQ
jgi:hypothetical protein